MRILTDQRVAIFIDSMNIQVSAKMDGFLVDYQKLIEFARGGRKLQRSIAYLVKNNEDSDMDGFKNFLAGIGIEAKIKDVIRRADGSSKADWDMQIAIDAINIASRVDTIIILSGDGDFIPLIADLKSKGVRVEVCSVKHSTATSLIENCPELLPDELRYLYPNQVGKHEKESSR